MFHNTIAEKVAFCTKQRTLGVFNILKISLIFASALSVEKFVR